MKSIKMLEKAEKKIWKVCALSECGRRRENQDNYLLINPEEDRIQGELLRGGQPDTVNIPDWPPTHIRLAISDGMGGHEKGEEIAREAVTLLTKIQPQSKPTDFRDEIFSLHKELYERFHNGEERSPGATLIVADVEKRTGKGVMAHIGDSRAFIVRGNQWNMLTYDHNGIEFSYRDGEIDKELYKARLKAGPHRLIQALGYGSTAIIPDRDGNKNFSFDSRIRLDLPGDNKRNPGHPDVFSFELAKGDILFLATDGLWSRNPGDSWTPPPVSYDYLTDKYFRELIKEALDSGSRDNITIAACGRK